MQNFWADVACGSTVACTYRGIVRNSVDDASSSSVTLCWARGLGFGTGALVTCWFRAKPNLTVTGWEPQNHKALEVASQRSFARQQAELEDSATTDWLRSLTLKRRMATS